MSVAIRPGMRHLTKILLATSVAALASCTVGSAGGGGGGGGDVPAPTAFAVTPVNGGAHLTWTDNATDETMYMVMRMEGANDYEVIAELPADSALYHDASVTAGTTYMYMVMVMNPSSEAESAEVVFTAP